jgi:hypothetical protein
MCTKLDIYVFIVSYHHYKILFTSRLKMLKISNLEDRVVSHKSIIEIFVEYMKMRNILSLCRQTSDLSMV